MTDQKLKRMRIRYELEDGTAGEVLVHNKSLVTWDTTRAHRQWPSSQEAPMLWSTFLCWHALVRIGETSLKWDQFQDAAVLVAPVNEANEDVEDPDEALEGGVDVDPTQPGAEPVS